MKILMVGDVVGSIGMVAFQKHVDNIKKKFGVNFIVVNGENSADGRGITVKIVNFYKHNGVDVITSGNHIWSRREIYPYLDEKRDLLRPANFPNDCPGTGVTVVEVGAYKVGVINLQGRVFMKDDLDCPFRTADTILTYLNTQTNIVVVDFHAETTAEKNALAYYLEGRVSAMVGSHTHVQTADERVLPGGTAYITDVGMVGVLNSMIGMQKESIIQHFLTQMPHRFVVEDKGAVVFSAVVIDVDNDTGKAISIERIQLLDSDIKLNGLED